MLAVPTLAVGLIILLWLGFFDTMIARFHYDIGSAYSRQLAFDLLSNLSASGWWFGLSAAEVQNLVTTQQELGLIAIEISWVNFILVCGLIFTIPLFVTYVLFLVRFLPKYCGWSAVIPAMYLLVTTSSSNGIWAKTTALCASLALLFSFARKTTIYTRSIRKENVSFEGRLGFATRKRL